MAPIYRAAPSPANIAGTWLAFFGPRPAHGEIMESTDRSELVGDPVAHISISGVHGRDELAARLKKAKHPRESDSGIGRILAGMLIGAAAMYLLGPKRPQNGA